MIWEDVGGVRTEVYHVESRRPRLDAKEHIHLILCPGNPGCLFFYLAWLQDLQCDIESLVKDDVCVSTHGLSHANHHFKDSLDTCSCASRCIEYSFEEQIDHFEAFCEGVVRDAGTGAKQLLVLVGHSIGAYAVVEVLNRNAKLRKQTVAMHLLMPFIQWRNLGFMHAMKIRLALSVPSFLANFLADRVPTAVEKNARAVASLIRKSHKDMDSGSIEMTAEAMLSRRLLLNFISMARSEVSAVRENEDVILQRIQRLSRQISTYTLYTDDDVWAPLRDSEMLKAELPHVVVGFKEGLTHAFSTSFEKGNLVRRLMMTELAKVFTFKSRPSSRGREEHILSKL